LPGPDQNILPLSFKTQLSLLITVPSEILTVYKSLRVRKASLGLVNKVLEFVVDNRTKRSKIVDVEKFLPLYLSLIYGHTPLIFESITQTA
jgi:hypothetical protein